MFLNRFDIILQIYHSWIGSVHLWPFWYLCFMLHHLYLCYIIYTYVTSFNLCYIISLLLHHFTYVTSFLITEYECKIWFIVPENFLTQIYKLAIPIKFFHLKHTPIQTFSHTNTKIFHIFRSNIWFINHTHFKC